MSMQHLPYQDDPNPFLDPHAVWVAAEGKGIDDPEGMWLGFGTTVRKYAARDIAAADSVAYELTEFRHTFTARTGYNLTRYIFSASADVSELVAMVQGHTLHHAS